MTEFALTHGIARARQAVHDDGTVQRVIKTLHQYGYRFVAAVEWHAHTLAADAQPAGRLLFHEAAALPSPSPVYQAATTLAGCLRRKAERKHITFSLSACRASRP